MANFRVNLNNVLDLPVELQVGGGIIVVVGGVLISSAIIENRYVKRGMFLEAEKVSSITHAAVPIVVGCMLLYMFIEGVGMFL